jgi:hypothetical protein
MRDENQERDKDERRKEGRKERTKGGRRKSNHPPTPRPRRTMMIHSVRQRYVDTTYISY